MDSSLTGKIHKAKRYAQETDRIAFEEFRVTFQGDHGPHRVSFTQGKWNCDCRFFAQRGVCSHSMAMERILGGMLRS